MAFGDTSDERPTGATTTVAGTPTSHEELQRAGVGAYDGHIEVERKLSAARGTPTTYYAAVSSPDLMTPMPPEMARSLWKVAGIVAVLVGLVWAIGWLSDSKPVRFDFDAFYKPMPSHLSGAALNAARGPEIEAMQQWTSLYRRDAPLQTYYRFCSLKDCVQPDYTVFAKLQPYAVNPTTYWPDVCEKLRSTRPGGGERVAPSGKWNITAGSSNPAATHLCYWTGK